MKPIIAPKIEIHEDLDYNYSDKAENNYKVSSIIMMQIYLNNS